MTHSRVFRQVIVLGHSVGWAVWQDVRERGTSNLPAAGNRWDEVFFSGFLKVDELRDP